MDEIRKTTKPALSWLTSWNGLLVLMTSQLELPTSIRDDNRLHSARRNRFLVHCPYGHRGQFLYFEFSYLGFRNNISTIVPSAITLHAHSHVAIAF
jgi:hypothetical protein